MDAETPKMPETGGSWMRDPVTGELTQIAPPTRDAVDTDRPVAVEPSVVPGPVAVVPEAPPGEAPAAAITPPEPAEADPAEDLTPKKKVR